MIQVLLSAILTIAPFLVAIGFVFFVRRRRARRRREQEKAACLRCGYPLLGLSIPRCPECGTLAGFNVPMSEMGVSDSDLRP